MASNGSLRLMGLGHFLRWNRIEPWLTISAVVLRGVLKIIVKRCSAQGKFTSQRQLKDLSKPNMRKQDERRPNKLSNKITKSTVQLRCTSLIPIIRLDVWEYEKTANKDVLVELTSHIAPWVTYLRRNKCANLWLLCEEMWRIGEIDLNKRFALQKSCLFLPNRPTRISPYFMVEFDSHVRIKGWTYLDKMDGNLL